MAAGALPRGTSGERVSAGSQGRPPAPPNPSDQSPALQLLYGTQPPPRGSGSGGNISASGSGGGGGGVGVGGGGANNGGQNGGDRRSGPTNGGSGGQGSGSTPTRWNSGNNGGGGNGGNANGGGVLPRVPSIGAQSSGGSWLDGYSSGEDLTSEEHLDLTRRTIKRTLSNSSIASVSTFRKGIERSCKLAIVTKAHAHVLAEFL